MIIYERVRVLVELGLLFVVNGDWGAFSPIFFPQLSKVSSIVLHLDNNLSKSKCQKS